MGSEKPGGGGKGWAMSARRCDACRSAAANLFCRSDSAFFCLGCDAKLHAADKFGFRHERVWMCDVCEQSPASVTCKADAAALCVTCDADIHTANPLARRHERFPVVPFYDSAPAGVKRRAELDQDDNVDGEIPDTCQEDAEAAAWLLPIPGPKLAETLNLKPGDYFFSDVDPFLDLDNGPPGDGRLELQINPGRDSVVPVQTTPFPPTTVIGLGSDNNCFDPDYTRPKPSYSYTTPSSLSHSVSSSSLDFGVVPDEADITCGGTASCAPVAQQLSALDREARVLRYREKRKKRKFEKTIRYASRKAYAETRPRIKGRFAKRLSSSSDVETEVDRMYSSAASAFMAEGYGVVPSF